MNDVTNILLDAGKKLNKALAEQLRLQGHTLTGALEESLRNEVVEENGVITLQGFANYYEEYVNQGVPADRIPYGGSSGKGNGSGESKYIQALIRYAMLRMKVDEVEAKKIAFAIANTHKKEGMPTQGSYAYSETGERLGFLQTAFAEEEEKIDAIITSGMDEIFNNEFEKLKEA